jgi:hypothetical protein
MHQGSLERHYLLTNFMNIYEAVQKLFMGDRQTGDLIKLLSFLESRLKSIHISTMTLRFHNHHIHIKHTLDGE